MTKIFKTTLVLMVISTLFLGVISVSATEIVSGYGDVNLDNEINSSDLVYFRKSLLSDTEEEVCVDVNGDGDIDVRDLVRLKKILVSYISNDWVDKELGEQGSHDIF